MSFMDLTEDFITYFSAVFIMAFNANFMLNPPNFIIDFMEISLHLPDDDTKINNISWIPHISQNIT